MAMPACSVLFFPRCLLGLLLLCSGVSLSAETASPRDTSSSPEPAGVITLQSHYTVRESGDRLESILVERGMILFGRINHARSAATVGAELRDTELLLFGHPRVGSPLIQCQQSVALDLPQKALIWQGPDGNVWISYNDPRYLQQRHRIAGCDAVLAKMAAALGALIQAAAQ